MDDTKPKRILIVEDEKILGDILSKKLSGSGFEVFWETDGDSGLKKIKEVKPDLILLDILMTKMNGFELLETMHKDLSISPIPVIIISNSGYPVQLERAMALGVRDYIVKAQFNLEDIMGKIRKHIGAGPVARSVQQVAQTSTGEVTIFIVEDDTFLASLSSRKFEQDGYRVLFAPDGDQALRILESKTPDIILLDLVLPGMSGFDVLKKIRELDRLKNVPVIVFSNLGDEGDVEKAKKLGANEFFIKANFTLEEVSGKIKSLVGKKTAV